MADNKRATCRWADNALINQSVSICHAPIPRCVIDADKAHVTDSVCDRCPCWQEKEKTNG
ncbi:MAG: hypothetical protein ABFD89_09145 [Bryobacteraceae bacterium]